PALAGRGGAYRATPWKPGAACAACWGSPLTSLSASFISTGASLDLGVYHDFGTGNQDTPNPLAQDPASAINLVHPFLQDSAETQASSALPDRRYLAKVTPRGAPFSLNCLTSGLSWIRYPTPISSIPIIRNEELFLLRTGVYWFADTWRKLREVYMQLFVCT